MSFEELELEDCQSWALERFPAHRSTETRQGHDILFLHGMAAGSWVWTPEWVKRFAGAGFDCWTMALPGRRGGGTITTDPLAFDRALSAALESGDINAAADALTRSLPGASLFDGPDLDDYTHALDQAVQSIGRPTIVVSHSLGGAVVQNLLRRGQRPAATVLLCSAPPYGTWRASLEMAATNLPLWKALFDFTFLGLAATDLNVMRRNLFPNGIGDSDFRRLLSRFSDESLAATARTPGFPPFAPLPGPRSDMLVIGATEDRFVPPLDVHLTALYYGVPARMIAGAGHMPMFEPDHAGPAAQLILDWIAGRPDPG